MAPRKRKATSKASSPKPILDHLTSDSDAEKHVTRDPPPAKKSRGGKPKGAQAFNEHDQNRLLQICQEILPFGSDLWETVSTQYTEKASQAGRKARDAQWLKKYFTDLVKRAKPTGDPNQPEEVRWAKVISASIEEKINMVTLDDEEEEDKTSEVEDERNESDNDSELEKSENIASVSQAAKPQAEPITPAQVSKAPGTPASRPFITRIRTTKPSAPSQSKQALDHIFSSLKDSGSEITSMTQHLERSSMLQALQNQLDRAEGKVEKMEEKVERLQVQNEALKDENREMKMKIMLLDRFNHVTAAAGGEASSLQMEGFSAKFGSL